MIALFGSILFELLDGFSTDSASHSVTFAKHDVISGKPRLQATGNNLSTRNLAIKLHWKIADVNANFYALKNAMESQKPLPLIFGSGRYDGFYVIDSLNDTTLITNKHGAVLVRECTIQLTEYAMTAEELLEYTNASDKLGLSNSILPIESVINTSQQITAYSQQANSVLSTIKTYKAVTKNVMNLASAVATSVFNDDDLSTITDSFTTLSAGASELYKTEWITSNSTAKNTANTASINDNVNDFVRFTNQAETLFKEVVSVIYTDANQAKSQLDLILELLSAANKSASALQMQISIRGVAN